MQDARGLTAAQKQRTKYEEAEKGQEIILAVFHRHRLEFDHSNQRKCENNLLTLMALN